MQSPLNIAYNLKLWYELIYQEPTVLGLLGCRLAFQMSSLGYLTGRTE